MKNQLLIEFLEREERKLKDKGADMLSRVYTKALTSYPLEIKSGTEAKCLEGIGDFLAQQIDNLFEQQQQTSSSQAPKPQSMVTSSSSSHLLSLLPPLPQRRRLLQSNNNEEEEEEEPNQQQTQQRPLILPHPPLPIVTSTSKTTTVQCPDISEFNCDDFGNIDVVHSLSTTTTTTQQIQKSKKPRAKREYNPKPGSGAHALIVALYRYGAISENTAIRKQDLIDKATPLSDTSFAKQSGAGSNPAAGNGASKFYTAWSSMKILIEKGLVLKVSSPALYYLSEEGEKKARGASNDPRTRNTLSSNPILVSTNSQQQQQQHEIPLPIQRRQIQQQQSVSISPPVIPVVVQPQIQNLASKDLPAFCFKCGVKLYPDSLFCHKCGNKIPTNNNSNSNNNNINASIPSPPSSQQRQQQPIQLPIPIEPLNFEPVIEAESASSFDFGENNDNPIPDFASVIKLVDVEIVIDLREVGSRKDRDYLQRHLDLRGIKSQVKQISLGDIIWIGKTDDGKNVVLDYVIERKTLDDMASSIISSHLQEQKFRLHQGPLSHVFILAEGDLDSFVPTQHYQNINKEALQAEMSIIIAIDKFSVRMTGSIDETVDFLETLTALFREEIKTNGGSKLLPKKRLSLDEYNDFTTKNRNLTVGDVFTKQLLQIRRMPAEGAQAISEHYGNALNLWKAYQECLSEEDRQSLLSDLALEIQATTGSKKRLGSVTSVSVSQLFTPSETFSNVLQSQSQSQSQSQGNI